jgi:hypothetical protein
LGKISTLRVVFFPKTLTNPAWRFFFASKENGIILLTILKNNIMQNLIFKSMTTAIISFVVCAILIRFLHHTGINPILAIITFLIAKGVFRIVTLVAYIIAMLTVTVLFIYLLICI